MTITPTTTPSRQQSQAQTIVLLLCASRDRRALQQLADEAERHMQRANKPEAIITLYGISSKQRTGFLIVQGIAGIPLTFWQWMQQTPEIVDYIANDTLPLALTELQARGYQDVTEEARAAYDAFPYLAVLFRDGEEGPVYCSTEQDVMALLHRVRQAAQGYEPEANERGG